MSRSKYINTFNTTAEYKNYIESALPKFPNVGYDKQAGVVNIRRTSPNDYQIWGTTTATENFNIKLNNKDVEVTVDPLSGEFYLTGWSGTLTSLQSCFDGITHITSIKKITLDTSNVTTLATMFRKCTSLESVNLTGINTLQVTNTSDMFSGTSGNLFNFNFTDVNLSNVTNKNSMFTYLTYKGPYNLYLNIEGTLMNLTSNLSSSSYIPSVYNIYYDNGSEVILYKWQNNKWTPQS